MTNLGSQVSPLLRSLIIELSEMKLIKRIGQGGFGEVYLAIHEPTKRECAVKKLFIKEAQGSNITLFKREAEILAACNNPFCLTFLGWTSTYPYSIVTDYVSNGSLYQALKEGSLTGTEKTIIAIGISVGLSHLHSIGVVHRDMKSLNVLLNKDKWPVICDFGLSRFSDEETVHMTRDVGTPHWMAPEMFEGGSYDKSVDTYAYGILLWEMLTESTPFKGMSGLQIAVAVCQKDIRPAIPAYTPKRLGTLISACWNRNPRSRPAMNEIIKVFKHSSAHYPETDTETIKKFISYIETMKPTRPPPLSSKSSQKQALNDMSILSNPTNEGFGQVFERCSFQLSVSNAAEYYSNLRKAITQKTDSDTLRVVLPEFLRQTSGELPILIKFVEYGLHLRLPLDHMTFESISLRILLNVVSRIPAAISAGLLEQLKGCLSRCPQKVLKILSVSCCVIEKLKSGGDICSFIMDNAEVFMSSVPNDYLKVIAAIAGSSQKLTELHMDKLASVITMAKQFQDETVVHSAYCLLCLIPSIPIELSEESLTRHLSSPVLAADVASYLLRRPGGEHSQELILGLLSSALSNRTAFLALLTMVASSEYAAATVISEAEYWASGMLMSPSDSLRLLLAICLHPRCLQLISSHQAIPKLLSLLASIKDLAIITATAGIVLKLASSTDFVSMLSEAGYFGKYLKTVPHLADPAAIQNSIFIIDTLSRSQFIADFLEYVPYMLGMLQSESEYTPSALSAIAAISSYTEAKNMIRMYDTSYIFQALPQNPSYRPYVAVIQQNITT